MLTFLLSSHTNLRFLIRHPISRPDACARRCLWLCKHSPLDQVRSHIINIECMRVEYASYRNYKPGDRTQSTHPLAIVLAFHNTEQAFLIVFADTGQRTSSSKSDVSKWYVRGVRNVSYRLIAKWNEMTYHEIAPLYISSLSLSLRSSFRFCTVPRDVR